MTALTLRSHISSLSCILRAKITTIIVTPTIKAMNIGEFLNMKWFTRTTIIDMNSIHRVLALGVLNKYLSPSGLDPNMLDSNFNFSFL